MYPQEDGFCSMNAPVNPRQHAQSAASQVLDESAVWSDQHSEHSQWYIEEMDCPTEEGLIRKRLGQFKGIEQLDFQLMQRKLTVVHETGLGAEIESALRGLGMSPVPAHAANEPEFPHEASQCQHSGHDHHDSSHRHEQREAGTHKKHKSQLHRIVAAVTLALIAELGSWWSGASALWFVLAFAAILLSGLQVYKKGWIALKNRNLNINALMSIAVTGAILIGQWPEAAMVMVLFALAEVIEAKSIDRARNAIRGLMEMAPETATVRQNDGSWAEVDSKTVAIGTFVRVRPGERIGLDGTLVSGRASINQAPITGESLPVEKSEGDPVFAGTINESGSFEYRVTAVANNTTLARIIHAVEDAQGARAPTQRFVDRFSKVYTPAVFALAVLVALIPPLLMGEAWFDWVYRALVLLVVACPCALVISTPVTIVSGLAAATRHGILVKGGV